MFDRSLTWNDVKPANIVFDRAKVEREVSNFLAVSLATYEPRVQPSTGRDFAQKEILDGLTNFMVERYGRWSIGWRCSQGEGDGLGGVVVAWCCAGHSFTTDVATLSQRVISALQEWHDYLRALERLFKEVRSNTDRTLDTETALSPAAAEGVTKVVCFVAEQTLCEDAWYNYAEDAVTWLLEAFGQDSEDAKINARSALGGRFESWVEPAPELVNAVSTELGGEITRWLAR